MENKKQTAINKIIHEIKEYVRLLDKSDNNIYNENEILILSCFSSALEICEKNLQLEKKQIIESCLQECYSYGEAEQYYKETYGDD